MADNDRVINRIRKLMALANDKAATDGERDNALRMAYATLAKHNLSMTDVGDGLASQEERNETAAEEVVYPWARTIAHAVGKLFFCSYYFQRPLRGKKGKHCFVGRVSNSATAAELTSYIIRSVSRESARLFGSATSPSAVDFDKGVAARIWQRCAELRRAAEAANKAEAVATPGTALVLASLYESEQQANDAWLKAAGTTLTFRKRTEHDARPTSAYAAGKNFGDKVHLGASLGNSERGTLRLKGG